MYYVDIYSDCELDQNIIDYRPIEFKVKDRTKNCVKLIKNKFSQGIFIILLFFLNRGANINCAVKNRNLEEVIIRNKNKTAFHNSTKNIIRKSWFSWLI